MLNDFNVRGGGGGRYQHMGNGGGGKGMDRNARINCWQLIVNTCSFGFMVLLVIAIAVLNPMASTEGNTQWMRENMENSTIALKDQLKDFPDNQVEMTAKQVLGIIDHANALITSIDEDVVGGILVSANDIMHDVALMMKEDDVGTTLLTDIHHVVGTVKKFSDAITPQQVVQTSEAITTVLQETGRIMSNINHDDISTIVQSVQHISTQLDVDHTVDTLTQLAQSALEIANHLKQNPTVQLNLWNTNDDDDTPPPAESNKRKEPKKRKKKSNKS